MDYYFIKSEKWNYLEEKLTAFLMNPEKPLVIWISGPACMGKSSLAIELCHILGIRNYISTDLLRIVLAENIDKPNIFTYQSHECWQLLGDFSEHNLIKGFKMQSLQICSKLQSLYQDIIKHRKNTIIEGIHLLPEAFRQYNTQYSDLKMISICLTSDFNFFSKELLKNRTVSTYRHLEYSQYNEDRMEKFHMFFEMWNAEFPEANIKPIINTTSQEKLTEKVLQKILDELTVSV